MYDLLSFLFAKISAAGDWTQVHVNIWWYSKTKWLLLSIFLIIWTLGTRKSISLWDVLTGAKCTTEASRMTVVSGNPSSSSQLHALLNFLLSEELAHLQPFLFPVWKIPDWDQTEQFKYSLKWQLSSNLFHKWSSQHPPTHIRKECSIQNQRKKSFSLISSASHWHCKMLLKNKMAISIFFSI